MNSAQPIVSVCIPVYNAGKFLSDTLDALLLQDYPKVEIVVVDDQSTDGSAGILSGYSDKIKVCQSIRKGANPSRNQAFENCTGDYIIFFDADDWVPRNFISSQVECMVNHRDCVVVSEWGRFFETKEDYRKDPNIVEHDLSFHDWIIHYWTRNNHMTPPGRVMIPRNVLVQAGLWNEELSLNDDLEFFSRIFNAARKILYNGKSRFYYRSGVGGVSSKVYEYHQQVSNFRSIDTATNIAHEVFPNDPGVRRASANMWQLFIYENYPHHRSLTDKARQHIKELGGSDFEFPAGGVTKTLLRVFGWKLTKKVKKIIPVRRS